MKKDPPLMCEFNPEMGPRCTNFADYQGYTRSLQDTEIHPPGYFFIANVCEDHKMCLIGFQNGKEPDDGQ